MIDTIFYTPFGARLYGTATAGSDRDFKGVFVPSSRDILMQQAPDTIRNQPNKERLPDGSVRRNDAGDFDEELFSIRRFLDLVAEGQTVALDTLFAYPLVKAKKLEGVASPLMDTIFACRHRLASRRCQAFIGYCRQQANKYGIKGSRMAAAEKAATFFAGLPNQHAKLQDHSLEIVGALHGIEHINFLDIELRGQGKWVKHIEVCGRKIAWTVPIKEATKVYTRLFFEYGERARQAKDNDNVDWKAVHHAIRVGEQALEYLQTGNIIFPRPNADQLLRVKKGEVPYQECAQLIEALLEEIEPVAAASTLPPEPDRQWIETFVLGVHTMKVKAA